MSIAKTTIKIAARQSPLARLQAYLVGDALKTAHPHLKLEYQFRASLGDQRPNDPLWQMPEKGVFTADLRADLLAGKCDLLVHSWKDLPLENDSHTKIAATLPRADQRDLLLVNAERWPEVHASGVCKILTSSPRRAHNLRSILPAALPAEIHKLEFLPVRGNIQTRVEKLFSERAHGLIVAKAAIDRLLETERAEFVEARNKLRQAITPCFWPGFWPSYWMVLPLRWNPTAPGQGALAIEINSGDQWLCDALQAINCPATFDAVTKERNILQSFGGGCHQAIGASVFVRPYGEITCVRGVSEQVEALQITKLDATNQYPPPVHAEEFWPHHKRQANWFLRTSLPAMQPSDQPPLWIAKHSALPKDWTIEPTQLVWASGWETWQKLAARGIWVHGCAEGLGENEAPRIEALCGRQPEFLKLTHDKSATQTQMKTLATYHLAPKNKLDEQPNWANVKYCFWSSGSAFLRAIELHPELRDRAHFCGPGATQATLLDAGITPHVCLDHDHWLALMNSEVPESY